MELLQPPKGPSRWGESVSNTSRWARLVRRGLFPGGLLATGLLIAWAILTGHAQNQQLALVPLGFLAVLTMCEWSVGRARPNLPMLPRDLFFFVLGAGLDTLARVVIGGMGVKVGGAGFGVFGALPLWVAIPLGLILADGGAYVVHRLFHRRPFLWRIHALHHYPEELYSLMSTVNGPLMVFFVRGVPIAVLVLLGFSGEVLMAYILLDAWIGLSQHTGVETHHPWLSALLITPEMHRMHHSNAVEDEGNFALMLTLWDRLWGTYVPPRVGPYSPQTGLIKPEEMPASWVGMLLLKKPSPRPPCTPLFPESRDEEAARSDERDG